MTHKPKEVRPKPAAEGPRPEHLILTIVVDRQTGVATVFGNADGARDQDILIEVIGQVQNNLYTKRAELAIAAANHNGTEPKL